MNTARELITPTTNASDACRIWENDQREILRFIDVVKGQREEAELPIYDIDHHDLFCFECGESETSPRPESLRQFASRVYELGWRILSDERYQVECPACQLIEPKDSDFAIQFQEGSGGLA